MSPLYPDERNWSPAFCSWIRKNSVVAMPEPGRTLANPATILEKSALLAGDRLPLPRRVRVRGDASTLHASG